MVQQPSGHYMVVQNLNGSGRIQGRSPLGGGGPNNQRLGIVNPALLRNYQPNQIPVQDQNMGAFGGNI